MFLQRCANDQPARGGTAATELALLLPFLALLFTAPLDFGRIYHVTQTLEDCALAGARYASQNVQTTAAPGPLETAKTAACDNGVSLVPPLTPEQVAVDVNNSAKTVTVTVSYDFILITPLINPSRTVNLKRTVVLNLAPLPGD